jgi:hypothetical protein
MNKKLLLAALVLGIFATILAIVSVNTKPQNAGSVTSEYNYKNITSSNASATVPVKVKAGFGTLGSVVVNTTHATIVRVYDSASATTTGTLIASFPASAVVGTYTFDVAVQSGIVLDVPAGFAGNYTVTYR